MNRSLASLAVLFGGLLIATSAMAYNLDQQVVIANRVVHPVRTGSGGMTAEQRVAQVNARLVTIIGTESLAPSNIHLEWVGGDPAIFVGRHLLETVTEDDARANNATKGELAQTWLAAYREILPQSRPNFNMGLTRHDVRSIHRTRPRRYRR